MRALLSEFQLPMKAWPDVVPISQSALNDAPLSRLAGFFPLKVFTGLPQDILLLTAKHKVDQNVQTYTISEVRAEQLLQTQKCLESLYSMRKAVHERSTAKRKSSVESHNCKTSVRETNFDVGHFVL